MPAPADLHAAAPEIPPEIARQVALLLGGGRIGVWRIVQHLQALSTEPVRTTLRHLPEDAIDAFEQAIREGKTIDQIVELLRGMGHGVSRSAVGRRKKSLEERLKRLREAQAIAGAWVTELKADAKGDVGLLLQDTLRTLALRTMDDLSDEEADPRRPPRT